MSAWEYKSVVSFVEGTSKYIRHYNPMEHPAATLDKPVGAQIAMAWREMFGSDWNRDKGLCRAHKSAIKWLKRLKQLALATFMKRQLPSSFEIRYLQDMCIDAAQAAKDILHLWEMNESGMKRKTFVLEIIAQIA